MAIFAMSYYEPNAPILGTIKLTIFQYNGNFGLLLVCLIWSSALKVEWILLSSLNGGIKPMFSMKQGYQFEITVTMIGNYNKQTCKINAKFVLLLKWNGRNFNQNQIIN